MHSCADASDCLLGLDDLFKTNAFIVMRFARCIIVINLRWCNFMVPRFGDGIVVLVIDIKHQVMPFGLHLVGFGVLQRMLLALVKVTSSHSVRK